MKRKQKILIGSLLMGAAITVTGYFGIRFEMNRRVMEREASKQGLQCLWRIDGQHEVTYTPSWWQVIRGARPTDIHLEWPAFESDHQATQEYAAALRFFGTLESVSVGYSCPEVMTLLTGLGGQPHLTQLNCFHAPVTDEISEVLLGFPHLQGISLVPAQFTAQGFPAMANLEAADFSFCPISVNGLRAIAASPKLTVIKLSNHPHPTQSLRAAVVAVRVSRPSLDIWGIEPH
ncbi:MAG: hypothetical protein V4710_12385 [Verrucomicrobiota bacterium]